VQSTGCFRPSCPLRFMPGADSPIADDWGGSSRVLRPGGDVSGNRTLRISFETPEAFRREYESNLCNGGAFIATDEPFEMREMVRVEVQLGYAHRAIGLESEIVHIVPQEMAQMGGRPGVAVQFKGNVAEVRATLERLVGETLPPPALPPPPRPEASKRVASRAPARIAARIQDGDAVVDGRTRNLSRTGALVGVTGPSLPVGETVELTLRHPTTGEELAVPSRVVRQVHSEGEVAALGMEFVPDGIAARKRVEHFVEEIQQAEHTRRLGGITGAIRELGPQDLIQMFASSTPLGTLYLRKGQDEGMIGFEAGLMRYVCLGGATGMKALVRMLAWREGSFEFHARLEEVESPEPPLPLQAAVFDAMRRIDEQHRDAARSFALDARFVVNDDAEMLGDPQNKLESAILDLARAGFTVGRMLEVIPEPDPEIFRALESLADQAILIPADWP